MNDLVIPLESVRLADTCRVGAKAAALGTLLEAGFPVPAGFSVTVDAFRLAFAPYREQVAAIMRAHDLIDPASAAAAAAALAATLADLRVPEPLVEALRQALPALGDTALAVRSSASAEDRADASFAGQYTTVLGARGEDALHDAILACWRSFFSANALAARATHAALGDDEAMAVLVQRMIEAECAGVCFTADPVRQSKTIVINAVWGLGVGAVDGAVPADTYRLLSDGFRLDERRIVEKPEQFELDPQGGVRRAEVPEDRRRAACLPEPWLHRVAHFGLAIENLLGHAQDLEWAIAGRKLWVLQSRPVTGLPPELAQAPAFPATWESDEERRMVWYLGGFCRDRVPAPLESEIGTHWHYAYIDASGFKGAKRRWRMKTFNGRDYFGPAKSRFHHGDYRVRRAALADWITRLRDQGITPWEYWGPEVVKATEQMRAVDLAAADGAKLADHFEDALGVLRRHWTIHWLVMVWPTPPDPLIAAYAKVAGVEEQAAGEAVPRLLEGEETALTRLIDGLYALAYMARQSPAVAALVAERPPDVIERLKELPEAEAFRVQFESFLKLYGDRTGSGYGSDTTLRTPTWHEEPALVLAMAAPYLDPSLEPPAAARARTRAARDAQIEALCAACSDPAAVAEFRRRLAYARRVATDLEEHNHYIDQMSTGQLRGAIVAAGRKLVERGALGAPEEIFWLRIEELLAALRAETSASLAETVAERQAQNAAWSALTPPPVLGVPEADLDERPPFKDELTPEVADGETRLTGQAASPGKRRGRARVVAMSTLLPDLAPGDVLVAENAGPVWTPIFPILGALVLDGGALTQHAATTAREYGIPAVIGTHNATRRIPEGAWVTVDGSAGTVELDVTA